MLADDTASLFIALTIRAHSDWSGSWLYFVFATPAGCIAPSCTEQSEGSPSFSSKLDDAITSIANSDEARIKTAPHTYRWVFVQMIQEHVVPSSTLSSEFCWCTKKMKNVSSSRLSSSPLPPFFFLSLLLLLYLCCAAGSMNISYTYTLTYSYIY